MHGMTTGQQQNSLKWNLVLGIYSKVWSVARIPTAFRLYLSTDGVNTFAVCPHSNAQPESML